MSDGSEAERHIEDHGHAISVLPYDATRKVALLVSMPRAPVVQAGDSDLLETIAGALEGEPPDACAKREALEEAGLRLTTLEPIGTVWTMPSLSTERITLYLAPYGATDRVAAGGGAVDENEQIRIHELPLRKLWLKFEREELVDLKAIVLLQALRLRRPKLFA